MLNEINREERIEFSVTTASRHPQVADAYDPVGHVYKKEYVQPESWRLYIEMGASPRHELVEAYRWFVEQLAGDFEYEVMYHDKVTGIEGLSVEVPDQGEYRITLEVDLANGRSLTAQRHFYLRDFLVVAIGDSYFCGEGNPDKPGVPSSLIGPITCNLATFTKFLVEKANFKIPMEREARWQEVRAHRSYQSGPALAAKALQTPTLGIVVTFLNFARSGASIDAGLLTPLPSDDWTELGQVEELKRTVGDRKIDALLISTGGNDIEFPKRLLDLLRKDLIIVGAGGGLGDDAQARREEMAEANKQLEQLPGKFDKLAKAISPLNVRQTYLMEYPCGHFDTINEAGEVVAASGCGIFDGPDMDIDGKDAQVIKDSAKKLNKILQRTTQRYGWILVKGIAEAFAGHGRCSPEPFFVSAEESCKTQGDFRGTMHPNQAGHQAYGKCIQEAIYRYSIAPTIHFN